jgi:TonB family protein
LNLQGAKAISVIEEKLDTAPARAASVYADWLAESSPEQFVALLPRLIARLEDDRSVHTITNSVLKSRPDLTEQVLRAYRPVAAQVTWRAIVEEISLENASPELVAILIDGIDASEPDLREETVWAMIVRLSKGKNVPPPLLEAVAARAQREGAVGSPTWEQFGREILVRQLRQKAGADRSAYLDGQIAAHRMGATALASTSYLTNDEQRALKKGLGNQYPQPRATSTSPKLEPTGAAMRTIPTLWPGFLKSLFEASGCRPTPERDPPGVVSAKYRRDRTLQAMSISPTKISAECTTALTALARLTLADPSYPPPPSGAGEFLVLPLDREFFACIAEPRGTGSVANNTRGTIVPPKKTRDVKPIYPSEAQRQRVQGTVVIEATISAAGCITSAKVIRGVQLAMDFSALQAVWGWKFTPTLLGNVPVPVIMTVTVNFSLN